MTTIKEYLKKVSCKKCGNNDVTKMELYFVSERKSEKQPAATTKYVTCLDCNTVFKIDDKDHTKEFLLEPVTAIGG